jgi:large conductance mechanosensitive channel
MGFLSAFKKFALRGNVIDLAVGVIIGAAFGRIVTSAVNDILTPAILNPALKAANLNNLSELVVPGTAIKYGSFLSEVISFLIVALSLFMLVRVINRMKRREIEEQKDVPQTLTEKLLEEIRNNTRKS